MKLKKEAKALSFHIARIQETIHHSSRHKAHHAKPQDLHNKEFQSK